MQNFVDLEHTCNSPFISKNKKSKATNHEKYQKLDNLDLINKSTDSLNENSVNNIEQNMEFNVNAISVMYNPYNKINCEITLNDVQSILKRYGIPSHVRNLRLYQRAFVHKSYTKKPEEYNNFMNINIDKCPDNCVPLYTKSNERLEFIGDGVLECITKYYLYKRFPKEDEGFMTEKKIALVKNEHIGKLAIDMSLNKWFMLSQNAEEKNMRTNLKKLGCLFEAFLGALFLDTNGINIDNNYFNNMFLTGPGFQMSQVFIENIFDTHVNWSTIVHVQDNYKNILQEFIQKRFKVTPLYIILDQNNQNTSFEMGVFIRLGKHEHAINPKNAIAYSSLGSWEKVDDYYERYEHAFIFLTKASHKIKKKAEQLACKAALTLIQKN